jgi:plasmid stabilization system protein ParE
MGFLVGQSPTMAERVLDVILDTVESLSQCSERGRQVPEVDTAGVREIFAFRYRIIYQVSDAEVRILAILHDAMDFARALEANE